MKRAYAILFLGVAAFLCLQAAIFHSRLYVYWVSPESSTGHVETVIHNERTRVKNGPNQVLAIGDSRMALVPKTSNQFTAETGYTYASISRPGATTRTWYYMLRAVDPDANRYKAVLLTVDSYNDDETLEDPNERESDLNYLAGQLRLTDLVEFSLSYKAPQRRLRAAFGILLRGLVYQQDLQDFLISPRERLRYVRLSRQLSHEWFYNFRTDNNGLDGFSVDWERKAITPPIGATPRTIAMLKNHLVDPLPERRGDRSAYMKRWLSKIAAHYKGSETKLVFLRVPRAPWIRPDLPPSNPNSSLHQLEKSPNVILLPEHLTDELERPELFHDEMHLNQLGLDRFSEIVAHELPKVLAR